MYVRIYKYAGILTVEAQYFNKNVLVIFGGGGFVFNKKTCLKITAS